MSENKEPCEAMETDDTSVVNAVDNSFEEGEISNSEEDSELQQLSNTTNNFKSDVFVPVSNDLSKEDIKKNERAKRFSLVNKIVLNQEEVNSLYSTLGINEESVRHYRLNTIHVRGTQEMSTEEVLSYFDSLNAPGSVEWINDVSCNIVWPDHISAARAMLCLSHEIVGLDRIQGKGDPFKFIDESSKDDDTEDVPPQLLGLDPVDVGVIKCVIPPGQWRLGESHPKAKYLLLRFATQCDKKQPFAEKNSLYYKKHGNPRFNDQDQICPEKESFIKRVGKSFLKRNNLSKIIEGEASDKKNPWGDIAETWGHTDHVEEDRIPYRQTANYVPEPSPLLTDDLRNSLNRRIGSKARLRPIADPSTESDTDEWTSRSKKPRMKMHADEEQNKIETEKLQTQRIKHRIGINTSDLKSRREQQQKTKSANVTDLRSLIKTKPKDSGSFKLHERNKGVWTKVSVVEDSESEDSESDSELSGSSSSSESSSTSNEDNNTSNDWVLEEYRDLRESLQKSKKSRPGFVENSASATVRGPIESEEEILDTYHLTGRISPLQIEIDNEEYYTKAKRH